MSRNCFNIKGESSKDSINVPRKKVNGRTCLIHKSDQLVLSLLDSNFTKTTLEFKEIGEHVY